MHTPTSRRTAATFLVASLAAAVLAACGGSDGHEPVIGTQPLDLALPEGASGSMSVAATSDAGDIAYQWHDAASGLAIEGANEAALSVVSASLVDHGRRVNVLLSNAVGSTRSADATLSVVERGWSGPASVVAANSRQLASVVDSNGHVHLVGVIGNNLAAGVQARLQLRHASANQVNDFIAPAGSELAASASLSPTSTAVTVAANASGRVLAVWQRNGVVAGALYTPATDAAQAGSWAALPENVSTTGAAGATDPAVVALAGGDFEIVWRERIAPAPVHDVVVRRLNVASGTLGAAQALEADGAETAAPRLVADAAGNVLAAWRQGGSVVVNRRLAGDSWGTAATPVDTSGLPLEALRSNGAGRAVLLTSDRLGQALATRLDLAAANPLLDSALSVANAYGSAPDALVDDRGTIHVFGVSMDSANGHTRLYRWTFTEALGWSSAEPVSEVSSADFAATGQGLIQPRVSGVDAEGSFVVAWQERVSGGDDPLSHLSARRFHGRLGGWRATVPVLDSATLPPTIAMARDGRAMLAVAGPAPASVLAASLR